MITMRVRRSLPVTAGVAAACLLTLAGCASTSGSTASAGVPVAAVPALAPRAASVASTTCKDGANQVASIDPRTDNITAESSSVKPGASDTMDNIRKNGHLTVGTSGDVRLWGATIPATGTLEGYDIDLLNDIADAAGVPGKIVYRVINYGQRLTELQAKSVDVVAHTMTINCDRWQGTGTAPNPINFSTEYYRAGQKLLVRKDQATVIKTVQDLVTHKLTVCVPADSTNYEQIKGVAGLTIDPEAVVGDCLVKFQEGEVQAITGDDTVLAGFAAQDPYAKVVVGKAFTEEPYGLGINQSDPVFTEFVNAVLQKMRDDGSLRALYVKWMLPAVGGSVPAIPQAVYGRNPARLGRKA